MKNFDLCTTIFGLLVLMTRHEEIVDALLSDLFTSRTIGRNDTTIENSCEENRTPPRIALAIVGGQPMTSVSTAPYIAAIGEKLKNGSVNWYCGGSLVSHNSVLTAAHCVASRNADYVSLGRLYLNDEVQDSDIKTKQIILHPHYENTKSYHDLAIVKLNKNVVFTKSVRPICLPSTRYETYATETASVVGWGADNADAGAEGSPVLQQVRVQVFSNSECDRAYSNSSLRLQNFPDGITEQQLCAGSSQGGRDACQGDSGGPLVLADSRGVIRLIGVVSSGSGCGTSAYPGVYVRVTSYISWIEKNNT